TNKTSFEYYDDDGETYDHEAKSDINSKNAAHDEYFLQTLSVIKSDNKVVFETSVPVDSFKPELRYYVVKIHGGAAKSVTLNGATVTSAGTLDGLLNAKGTEGWASGTDKLGPVTYIRIKSGALQKLELTL
ncbi:MAG TPA: DUF5110 domain-containing protein, partial [Phyllobacterium sp.]|nr:DUF5110 domain-containing protein [Phyllobacterium sp.]